MPANGDIVEIALLSTYGTTGDEFMNVFHWRWSSNELVTFNFLGSDFVEEFGAEVVPEIASIIGVDITFTGLRCTNLDNPNDFFNGDFTVVYQGAVSGESMPPFVSWGFVMNRNERTTRNGYKRFSGVPESWVQNGIIVPANEAAVNNVAAYIGDDIQIVFPFPGTLVIDLDPVIVRKTGQFTYSVVNDVISATFAGVGSQNTRKFGRGQ